MTSSAMTEIHCHIPLKLTVTGIPTAEQWEAIEATLATRYASLIARSLAEIESRHHGVARSPERVAERFSDRRFRAGAYDIPGYDAGGAPVAMPLQVDPTILQTMTVDSVSRLSSEEIDLRLEHVLALIAQMKPGAPDAQSAHDNLKLLEAELDSRGYLSPVLARAALVAGVTELARTVSMLEGQQAGLFAAARLHAGEIKLFSEHFQPHGADQLRWIKAALTDARRLAENASRTDFDAAFADFGAAGTRLVAASFAAQLLSLWLAFMQLADVIMHKVDGFSFEHLFAVISRLWPRFQTSFDKFALLQPEPVQAAAIALPPVLDQLVAEHGKLIDEVEAAIRARKLIDTAMLIADLITMLATLRLASPRMPGPPMVSVGMMGGGVTAGGALVGSRLVVSVEWLEMIRRLVTTGVIAVPVVAAGARAGILMNARRLDDVPTASDVISGGTKPLVPGQSQLGHYGIDKYGSFYNRPGDKLAGHEMLQNLWLEVKGFGKRGATDISKNNPAIALGHNEHVLVGRHQRALGLFDRNRIFGMSATEIIEANAEAMKRAGVPDAVITTLRRQSLSYAATLRLPSGGAAVP